MEGKIGKTQIGKQGLTDNLLETINSYFKTHKIIKISVLQSARPEGKEGKKKVREYEDMIKERLGSNYKTKKIGHTIVIKKLH